MDQVFYLTEFTDALSSMEKESFTGTGTKVFAGIVMDSVAIKVYKEDWSADRERPLTSPSRIFFSIWVNEKTMKEGRLYYNIHALKLRQFPGYKITSRDFAADFRKQFKKYHEEWPNADTGYGPLTLMQGWLYLNNHTLKRDITMLVKKFLDISHLVDTTLAQYRVQ